MRYRAPNDGFDGVGHVCGLQHFSGILARVRREFRVDAARANRAHANSVGPQILGHALGQPQQAPLRGAINTSAREGALARHRSDIDDVAAAALDHPRRDGFAQQEHGFQVGVEHGIPLSSEASCTGTKYPMPALLTRISMGPSSCSVFGRRRKYRSPVKRRLPPLSPLRPSRSNSLTTA
jgi:hypothetical protein